MSTIATTDLRDPASGRTIAIGLIAVVLTSAVGYLGWRTSLQRTGDLILLDRQSRLDAALRALYRPLLAAQARMMGCCFVLTAPALASAARDTARG